MAVHFTKEFLDDLRAGDDGKFVRHVLNHTVTQDGSFRPDRDDHRYEGIEDAWIRYVSKGSNAYRVIFIRKGDDIFLYRAGRHDVENHLQDLRDASGSTTIRQPPLVAQQHEREATEKVTFLKTAESTFISKFVKSMYHFRHHEVYLVSPLIDLMILARQHHFGRFLDKAVEEGTDIVLVTLPPESDEALEVFKGLEERDIDVFFLRNLHTKLYVFNIDLSSRNKYQTECFGTAIVGSSNLTSQGLGFDAVSNEELCCSLPSSALSEMRDYVTRLTYESEDYKKFAFKNRGRQK